MTAGDGDAVLEAHELGQQFAARDYGNLKAASLLHFGVLLIDGGTDHQARGSLQIRGGVALEDTGAHRGEAVGNRRELRVGARDAVAEIEQHFGDAAHADSTDAREMQMLGTEKHFLNVLFRLASQLSIKNVARTSRSASF